MTARVPAPPMTPPDLAGIIERDASARPEIAHLWTQTHADRRALLGLLAEVRGRVGPSHPHDPSPAICGACDVYNLLAALAEP